MEQTLKEYLDYPAGKGNASTGQKILRTNLEERYEALASKIKLTPYKIKKDGFLLHFLIPSESERENTYDVVLFVYGDPNSKNIKDWNFNLFSNSPAFYFTFAYAYNAYGMLINSLKSKLPKECYTKAPYVRNPHEVLGYEKSIFFAINHIMNESKLNTLSWLNANAMPFSAIVFNNKIRNYEKINYEIKLYTQRAKKKKEDERKAVLAGEKKLERKKHRKPKMTASKVGIIDGVYTPKKEKIEASKSTIKDKAKRGVRIISKR